jgi:hypothetical protein
MGGRTMTKSEEMDKAWDWWLGICDASKDYYMSGWILEEYRKRGK